MDIYFTCRYSHVSQESLDMVGIETIKEVLSSIGNAIKRFFIWLWEKIKGIFMYVVNLIRRCIKAIRRALGIDTDKSDSGKSQVSKLVHNSILSFSSPDQLFNVKYNLPEFTATISTIYDTLKSWKTRSTFIAPNYKFGDSEDMFEDTNNMFEHRKKKLSRMDSYH